MYFQRTLNSELSCSGVGLHLGERVNIKIKPAPPDSGICFIRCDLSHPVKIKASPENVVDTKYATTLGINGVIVATVEHILSAFAGLGIDNAIVEMNSSEIPIMDGSAAPFYFLMKESGIKIQRRLKKFIAIREPIKVVDGDREASLLPFNGFKISYTIDFDHPLLSNQTYLMRFSEKIYEREICRARTFGFLKEVEYMWSSGLAKGGSLENAVVIGQHSILNEDGLRFPDEFVRHKILDSLGDLSLLGKPIIGHFKACKSGHALNHKLVSRVMSNSTKWRLVEFTDKRDWLRIKLDLSAFPLLENIVA